MSRRLVVGLSCAFLLGLCLGILLSVPFFSGRLREMALELESSEQELARERARAESLEKAVPQEPVVEEVDCFVYCDDPGDRLEIIRRLSEITRPLLGRSLRRLDPYLLHNLLDGRRIVVEDREYRVRVEAVLASEKVGFYLRATPLSLDGQ